MKYTFGFQNALVFILLICNAVICGDLGDEKKPIMILKINIKQTQQKDFQAIHN